MVLRLLSVIRHFNLETKNFIDTGGKMIHDKDNVLQPVLERVFWCFPQCVEAFKHCKLVMTIDATFLTGKYKGTMMIAVEDQLLPISFAVTEGENNDS